MRCYYSSTEASALELGDVEGVSGGCVFEETDVVVVLEKTFDLLTPLGSFSSLRRKE